VSARRGGRARTPGPSRELALSEVPRPAQVKPQYLDSILEALKPHLAPRHLVISIAAGVRIASLEANLPEARLEPAAQRVRA